ncbi:DUF1700 domain-containing protein [Massilia sp. AB1]|uniref:DUF1700 domain-containing protein n=1 Tax=Massilia sp. AB1 TaxID=2823371 RepID=UPI001B823FFE|nr:DUF1700 domain-containing protein [Massilia sp. AB1]MBQ5938511.1 DUF1700 domain-containing protein [Massilia sp. AB1]
MGKLEYLDALKRAMLGLPPETQAKTLAWYEQRFVDGNAAGRREQEVADELGDPRKVAVSLRASVHMDAFKEKKSPTNILRMVASAAGLLVFNLFMAIPAAVYASLLVSLYASAFAFYVGGIAITASGLAGANELVLNGPLHRVTIGDDGHERQNVQTRISIGETGIHVYEEKSADPVMDGGDPDAENEPAHSRVIRGAEAVAERKIQITTDLDPESRTTQTLFGSGLVLGGIALFLISIVITKYTIVGVRRYVKMNLSLLKGS